MKTVVIIPTYNEKENIERMIHAVFKALPLAHILVVDDNSPDGTRDIVESLMSQYPTLSLLKRDQKQGLGKAYIHAFSHALDVLDPEVVVMMDADLSHPPHVLPMMLDRISEVDVVIGSRYIKEGDTVGWEMWRKALSKYGNLYARFVTGIPTRDLTAGFYMIRTSLLKKVDLNSISSSGYAFQIELKHLFHKAGGTFLEYPIIFKNRVGGESKISNHIIKEGVIAPWKIRFSGFFQVPVYVECPLCGGESKKWGEKNSYTLYQCTECKLLFVHPLPKQIDVYSQDYFSGAQEGFGYVDYDADKEPMIPVFERYLDMCKTYGKPKGKLFDIGAATGFFLEIAQKRGYDVSGVEYSSYATEKAKSKNLQVYSGDLLDPSIKETLEDGTYSVVSMLDVIEHMQHPFLQLEKVASMLEKDGLLLINTPNGESMLAKLLKTKWHLVVPPEHLFYFSPINLGAYLETSGFEVVYSGTIGKTFTFTYIYKTLYKWLGLKVFNKLADFFTQPRYKHLSIPINLHDNFFLIARKK